MKDSDQAILDVRLIRLAANPDVELTEDEQRLAIGAMARWLLAERAGRTFTSPRRER